MLLQKLGLLTIPWLTIRNLETVVPFSGFFLSVVGVVVMAGAGIAL